MCMESIKAIFCFLNGMTMQTEENFYYVYNYTYIYT